MDYKRGLAQLKECLVHRAPDALVEFDTLEARFHKSERAERLFGSSENTRNEHSQIIYALNELALKHCGISFNDLCLGKEPSPTTQPTPSDQEIVERLRRIEDKIDQGRVEDRQVADQILDALARNQIEQAEAAQMVAELRTWAQSVQQAGLPLNPELRDALDALSEHTAGAYQYLQLAIPIIPSVLSYNVELGSQHLADLKAIWKRVTSRLNKLRPAHSNSEIEGNNETALSQELCLYNFYSRFDADADRSDMGRKPECNIQADEKLVSGGQDKRGIYHHPPRRPEGSCRLSYPPISIPSGVQELRLDFSIGILDKRLNGQEQLRFSEVPSTEGGIRFAVAVNDERIWGKTLQSVGWIEVSQPIPVPADRNLAIAFLTEAITDNYCAWAAWGEPRLIGIREVQKQEISSNDQVLGEQPSPSAQPVFGSRTDSGSREDRADFAIITALPKEAQAVVRRFENRSIQRFEDQDIRTYHCGTVPIQGTNQAYRIVSVLLPNIGTVSAANAVTDTIARWSPRFVLMVGIAGGIPQDDLDLGDVVVADQIIGYEYSKIADQEIKPRDRVYPASALLLERVRNFWDDSWTQQVNVPRPEDATRPVSKLFVGPVASGNKVIASTEFRQQLKARWSKLIGLEMEGEGVFAAAFDRPQIPAALVVRGISDMADERKSDEWQEYAANAAAAFVVSFLKSGPVDRQQ